MDNVELIKALRWCGSEDEQREMCVDESYSCPMWNEDRMTDYCKADLMFAAADLIEAQEKRIAELEESNKMLKNTIDADKGVMLDRIRFLEAQLPKDGECDCHKCNASNAITPNTKWESITTKTGNKVSDFWT